MSKYSDALKEQSEVVVEGAPVVRVPHTEARAACPVTAEQVREFVKWLKQVSGVVVLPSFDGYHWMGTIDKLNALADWIAAQPAPAADTRGLTQTISELLAVRHAYRTALIRMMKVAESLPCEDSLSSRRGMELADERRAALKQAQDCLDSATPVAPAAPVTLTREQLIPLLGMVQNHLLTSDEFIKRLRKLGIEVTDAR